MECASLTGYVLIDGKVRMLIPSQQDLFLDNFLLDWHPQSLRSKRNSRPRVYIIDFETAVDFDADAKLEDCQITGSPFPKDVYVRPLAPELDGDSPYCPFMLDIWQFGDGFRCFKVSIHLSYKDYMADVESVLRHLSQILMRYCNP
jgi:hypothetical protein